MAETRWQDIYNHLKKSGFDVYSPGVKTGECTSNYVVVKNDGNSKMLSFSTNLEFYSVMCYVPQKAYSTLEAYKESVKKAMKGIYPMVKEYGSETPSFFDDSVKAHMISIEYVVHKKYEYM